MNDVAVMTKYKRLQKDANDIGLSLRYDNSYEVYYLTAKKSDKMMTSFLTYIADDKYSDFDKKTFASFTDLDEIDYYMRGMCLPLAIMKIAGVNYDDVAQEIDNLHMIWQMKQAKEGDDESIY